MDLDDAEACKSAGRELLGELQAGAVVVEPVPIDGEPVIVRMADVKPERVDWLWAGRIPLGAVTLLPGDPNLGKSFLTLDMAARVSRGTPWPDARDERIPAGGVVLLSAEDDASTTIRPRLDAAGADVTRIVLLQAIQSVNNGRSSERVFDLVRDLPALEQAIRDLTGARLVVIDPISAYLGGTDSHRNAEVRGVLAPLAVIAARHGVAVVCVQHLNKGTGGKAIYRSMGSLAFVAAARACWALMQDPDDKARRLLLPVKNNLAENCGGLAFSLFKSPGQSVPSIAWEAVPVEADADAILSRDLESDSKERRRTAVGDAAAWLSKALAEGPIASNEIKRQALANSISSAALRRANKGLNVDAFKRGPFKSPTWFWRLPGDTREPVIDGEEASDAEGAHEYPNTPDVRTFGEDAHLRAGASARGVSGDTEDAQVVEGAHAHGVEHLRDSVPPDPDDSPPDQVAADRQRIVL